MGTEPPRNSLTELLGQALRGGPDETLFWSGAGISADFPTEAPGGEKLTQRALVHAFLAETASAVSNCYRYLDVKRSCPRLETVLQVVESVHGREEIDDLLSDLWAPPNPLHGFFAGHLAAGGRHITMNFDTCIERSASAGAPAPVVHAHGSLAGGELGATLAAIERGFGGDRAARLRRVVLESDVRSLVFVGYSGSDFFDVDPFLAALPPGSMAGRTVLWISHDEKVVAPGPARNRQLDILKKAGAEVREIRCAARLAIAELGKAWGIEVPKPRGKPAPWRARRRFDADRAREATVELYALMGLHKEVDKLLDPLSPLGASQWEALASTRWAQGRYRDAGEAWGRARREATPGQQAEREGAIAWIRGEYRRARDILVEALESEEGSDEERLLLAEPLARLWVHMRRSPDSYLLATPVLREYVLVHLGAPERFAAEGRPLGVHLRNRVASARAALGVGSEDAAGSVASFGEFEALNAELNYRQARLRGRAGVERVPAKEFRALQGEFTAIGADGDAARAVLLGGPLVFVPGEMRRALRSLDVTGTQRLRLLGASVANGLLRGVRNRMPRAR